MIGKVENGAGVALGLGSGGSQGVSSSRIRWTESWILPPPSFLAPSCLKTRVSVTEMDVLHGCLLGL